MRVDTAPCNKNWHVIYTRSRAEKKVYSDLTWLEIESFLPMQKKLRQWKNRKKWVDMALITGYCFVHITPHEYDRVLHVNNVVSYVHFGGKAAIVPDGQIESLRQMLRQSDFDVEVSRNTFSPGKRVQIIAGPMMGMNGELMQEHGKNRFFVRINAINTVFIADVPAGCLTALPPESLSICK